MTRAASYRAAGDGPVHDTLYPPEPLPGLVSWYEAFWELSTDRRIGFGGVGPIPWTAIMAMAERVAAPEEVEMFLSCIRAMDAVFLSHVGDKKDAKPAARPMSGALFDALFG